MHLICIEINGKKYALISTIKIKTHWNWRWEWEEEEKEEEEEEEEWIKAVRSRSSLYRDDLPTIINALKLTIRRLKNLGVPHIFEISIFLTRIWKKYGATAKKILIFLTKIKYKSVGSPKYFSKYQFFRHKSEKKLGVHQKLSIFWHKY